MIVYYSMSLAASYTHINDVLHNYYEIVNADTVFCGGSVG